MFGDGNVILLQSQATGENIRVFDGLVQGTGDQGQHG